MKLTLDALVMAMWSPAACRNVTDIPCFLIFFNLCSFYVLIITIYRSCDFVANRFSDTNTHLQ